MRFHFIYRVGKPLQPEDVAISVFWEKAGERKPLGAERLGGHRRRWVGEGQIDMRDQSAAHRCLADLGFNSSGKVTACARNGDAKDLAPLVVDLLQL